MALIMPGLPGGTSTPFLISDIQIAAHHEAGAVLDLPSEQLGEPVYQDEQIIAFTTASQQE